MKEVLELSLDEIGSLVKKISELLTERNIVLLQGDLGTGKTTLVKAISKQLGVDEVT
ncbi:MAG: tRNA (adenosine(37)-N6)-threonylcarbamoyltransferase complex ATPase subunit type 1 TsaE, partial [Bacteroidia bacterium]|nr:tRNA (adenosine(37)-N6)-threonylcarbamoyltransferase complex ATPase subunit type 1 TsaE [Bacteroidia bacterium]